MNTSRGIAIIVGVLFIIATVTAIMSGVFLGSMLDTPEYFNNLPANGDQVITAMLFEIICAISVIGIAVVIYPVLKAHIEGLALGYVGIRMVEAIMLILGSLSLLSLLTLSQEYGAGVLEANNYQPLGALLLALRDWTHVLGTFLFLGLGGLPLYYILYRSKLVPPWLSGWGLIGATLILVGGVLGLFGLSPTSSTSTYIALPIGLQEMVFAIWLIVKGFNPSPIASPSPMAAPSRV
jgi:hypothetical protein